RSGRRRRQGQARDASAFGVLDRVADPSELAIMPGRPGPARRGPTGDSASNRANDCPEAAIATGPRGRAPAGAQVVRSMATRRRTFTLAPESADSRLRQFVRERGDAGCEVAAAEKAAERDLCLTRGPLHSRGPAPRPSRAPGRRRGSGGTYVSQVTQSSPSRREGGCARPVRSCHGCSDAIHRTRPGKLEPLSVLSARTDGTARSQAPASSRNRPLTSLTPAQHARRAALDLEHLGRPAVDA